MLMDPPELMRPRRIAFFLALFDACAGMGTPSFVDVSVIL